MEPTSGAAVAVQSALDAARESHEARTRVAIDLPARHQRVSAGAAGGPLRELPVYFRPSARQKFRLDERVTADRGGHLWLIGT